jgi:hypothetical protein
LSVRTTLWLALLVIFLGSVLYILDKRLPAMQAAAARSRVFDVTTEPITLMGIVREGQSVEMVSRDDKWFLYAPIRARGNEQALRNMAAKAGRLRSLNAITPEQRSVQGLTLADYGLDPAGGVFFLEAGDRREMLSLGSLTPFGGGVYGLKHDTGDVIVLPEEALELISPRIEDLRDRSLFPGSQRRVTRVDIHRRDAGFLQLLRRGDRWYIQQPVEWPVEPAVMQELLDALYVLQIQRFAWDAPAEMEDGLQSPAFRSQVEEASLAPDQARLRITVWVDGSDTGEELFLGIAHAGFPGEVYARRGGVASVFTVPERLVDVPLRKLEDFRDRRFLHIAPEKVRVLELRYLERKVRMEHQADTGWEMVDPVRVAARSQVVQQLLRDLSLLRVVAFDPVAGEVRDEGEALLIEFAYRNNTKEPQQPVVLSLKAATSAGESQWIGRMGVGGPNLRLDGFAVQDRLEQLLDPAAYRSLAVLRLDLSGVTRIQQTTVRGDVILERRSVEGGGVDWSLSAPVDRAVDTPVQRQLLAVLSRLDAKAVAAFEPGDLVPYGLHAPVTSLTFRFSDETRRIQQSLLLGRANEEGEVYALLQGHGFIFQLGREDAAALQADLLQSVVVPPQPPAPEAVAVDQVLPEAAGAAPVITPAPAIETVHLIDEE